MPRARLPKPHPVKRRTPEHVVADMSVNFLERRVLECGWVMEVMRSDYGIDAAIITFTPEGYVEPGLVYVQVKSARRLRLVDNGRSASLRLERSHIRAWMSEPFPVMIVLYDASSDAALWMHLQASASASTAATGKKRGMVSVRIPLDAKLSAESIQAFRSLKQSILPRLGHRIRYV